MDAMKPILSLVSVFGGLALLPALAAAQPSAGGRGNQGYYSQAPTAPGGFHLRHGMPTVGFSFGLGGMTMDDNNLDCPSCEYSPIGVEFDAHIGGMLSDRFALMLELQANAETVDEDYYGTTTLTQGAAMIAGQYWVSPRLWLKGGLGWSHLAAEYDDYYYGSASDPIDDGAALMAAAGFEVYSTDQMGIDLQARFITAGYDGINSKVAALTVGLGINWYGFGSGGGVIVIH
jgi:hypothetical protein